MIDLLSLGEGGGLSPDGNENLLLLLFCCWGFEREEEGGGAESNLTLPGEGGTLGWRRPVTVLNPYVSYLWETRVAEELNSSFNWEWVTWFNFGFLGSLTRNLSERTRRLDRLGVQ